MTGLDLAAALRMAVGSDPGSVPLVLASAAESVGLTDVVVYLIDFEQTLLEPLPDLATHAEVSAPEPVASTMAGRAFLTQRTITAERSGGVRVWVPILQGTERRGVIALTAPQADDGTVTVCEDLGLLAGHLIGTDERFTDLYHLHRRLREMSLAATMQWDLLPPLVLKGSKVSVAGLVEPAYHVGGDCFDYALNGNVLDLALFDAMGHGIGSAMVCALAIGCYRHDRRLGRLLPDLHSHLDATIADRFQGEGFATGQLARLDVERGVLTWTNAGHPLPLLIRGGRVIGQQSCPPTVPWGLGVTSVHTSSISLEPGDGVLFYTDGVVDGRKATAKDFGIERLSDLVGQRAADQLPTEAIVRDVVRAVLEYHEHQLPDDATVVLVRWLGSSSSEGRTAD